MKVLLLLAAMLLAPFAARAADQPCYQWGPNSACLLQVVPLTPDGSGGLAPGGASAGGTQVKPDITAPQTTTPTAFATNSIAAANTYQQVAANCPHGGTIENTSAVGTALAYVDWTGAAAGATALTNGAAGFGAPLAANQAGGVRLIPPTTNAIMVYGPATATYRGSCS